MREVFRVRGRKNCPNLSVPSLSSPEDGCGDHIIAQGLFHAASPGESSPPILLLSLTFCAEMGASSMKFPQTKAVDGCSLLDPDGEKAPASLIVSPDLLAELCVYFLS